MKHIVKILQSKRILGFTSYQIVILLFLIVMLLFLSDSSITKSIKFDTQIKDLESQIEFYQKQTGADKQKLYELIYNNDDLVKYACENYLLKKENEDVFII